jgi:hypothetical protein
MVAWAKTGCLQKSVKSLAFRSTSLSMLYAMKTFEINTKVYLLHSTQSITQDSTTFRHMASL